MQENKKILNIILSVLVLSYLISVINAFYALNFQQIIDHYYDLGITSILLIFPAYLLKHFFIDKYSERNFEEENNVPLWKKEIFSILNPVMMFFKHKLGFFFMFILSIHIITLFNFNNFVMQGLNNIGLNVFKGTSIWFLTIPCFIIVWLLSFYVLFLSKGKYKKIFPKTIFLFSFFLSSIVFAYNINFVISANLHIEIYSKLYKGVAETNTMIVPCEKKEILCITTSIEDLEKNKHNLLPQENAEIKYPEIKDSAEYIINRFVRNVKKSKEETVMYYYTSSVSLRYNDEWFAPIMVYNKNTNMLVVDFNNPAKILKMERYNKMSLIAISTIIWICFIFLINMFHDIFLQWRRKQVNEKEEEIRNSNEKDIQEEKVKEETPVKEDGSNNE